ncbi:hypothetical protein [Streptosporangium sp. KLBMP 9127]|nr:hypothetical protein [Streptosporangium sp. KLBMP 9127]
MPARDRKRESVDSDRRGGPRGEAVIGRPRERHPAVRDSVNVTIKEPSGTTWG